MFKGILSHTVGDSRAARRLSTVAQSARQGSHRHMRETARRSERQLEQLLSRQAQRKQQRRGAGASAATQASWTAAQTAALAEEDAAWAAKSSHRGHITPADDATAAEASHVAYDTVDADTGDSVLQQSFDALVHRALLRYGPPLPVEVVMENNVITAASMSPAQKRARPHAATASGTGSGPANDPSATYMDEVPLKMQAFMHILRKEKPGFSVRVDCDGMPLSLMVRNCKYLRAYGGSVNYMRFVCRLPREAGTDSETDARDVMVLSLGMYKMREMPAQDGVRQGPQPWRYSYHMM